MFSCRLTPPPPHLISGGIVFLLEPGPNWRSRRLTVEECRAGTYKKQGVDDRQEHFRL